MAPRGHTLSAESRAKITGRPISSNEPGVVHRWLRKHHPKAGICQDCGKVGKTDLAFLRHPAPYTRDRTDYRELCRSCHFRMDEPLLNRAKSMLANLTTADFRERGKKGAMKRWHSGTEYVG